MPFSIPKQLFWCTIILCLSACGQSGSSKNDYGQSASSENDSGQSASSQKQSNAPEVSPDEADNMPTSLHSISDKLGGLSIVQIQAAIRAGEFSIEALTTHYLERIESKNPELHAVISTNKNAIEQARQQDKALAAGSDKGLLFGIPIVVKDNIETQYMPTTAGSLALKGNATKRDASVIANLRAQGAIILAKTNLSEWANFRSTRSSSGWSAVGGQTRNPIDTSRSTCGSSSGSGAAVAAGLAAAALGTETDGSVVCPAALTGLVGIKPSVGLVSRKYIVPISHSQDTAGPMAKSVADAALLLSAMSGFDPLDIVTDSPPNQAGLQYHWDLDAHSLQGARIGILRSATGYHEGVDAVFNQAIETMRNAGAVIIDDLKFEPPKGFGEASYAVLLYEFKMNLNQYLAELPDQLPEKFNQLTLEKLIAFNSKHSDAEMTWFQQEIFEKAQALGDLDSEDYLSALASVQKATREDGIDRLMAEHELSGNYSTHHRSGMGHRPCKRG